MTNNLELIGLSCEDNQLNDLDVSTCQKLRKLYCGRNHLSQLDISDISNFFSEHTNPLLCGMRTDAFLSISNMPTLHEVCVSELPVPVSSFDESLVDTSGSPNVYFTTDCSSATSLAFGDQNLVAIYPNPATRQLTLELLNTQPATLELYSAGGKCVYRNEIKEGTAEIDVSGLSRGLYFLRIRQEHATHTEKIILQ